MKNHLHLFFFTQLFFTLSVVKAQWSVVGAPDFTDKMAVHIYAIVAPNGEPYVAFRDGLDSAIISSGRVMKFNGSSWVDVGPRFSAGDISCPTMAFDKYGTPYVAYMDRANCHKATVMKFDGSNWIPVGTLGFSPGAASYTSIAFDTSNSPYVAFRDVGSCASNSSPNGYRASVMKFDGTDWVYVGTPGFSSSTNNGGAGYTSLAIGTNGTLYVAFTDNSNNFKATVMTFNGSNWVNVGTGAISSGQSGSPSIVLDSDNVPYVAFVDVANSGKATVMKFDGSNWIPLGTAGFTPGNAEYTSLDIDTNDKLYIAFEDFANGHKASVMTFNGTSWVNMGNPGFSATKAQYTSLAVDNNTGTLYVAYQGYDYTFYPGTVMKYDISTHIKSEKDNELYAFNVYPNPSPNQLTLEIKTASSKCSDFNLQITDVLGKAVYSETIEQVCHSYTKNLSLDCLQKGVYFIRLQTVGSIAVTAGYSATQKIILQ